MRHTLFSLSDKLAAQVIYIDISKSTNEVCFCQKEYHTEDTDLKIKLARSLHDLVMMSKSNCDDTKAKVSFDSDVAL